MTKAELVVALLRRETEILSLAATDTVCVLSQITCGAVPAAAKVIVAVVSEPFLRTVATREPSPGCDVVLPIDTQKLERVPAFGNDSCVLFSAVCVDR